MKQRLLIVCGLTMLFGCVKDPKDISPNELFKVTIDNAAFENSNFVADNSIIYKIDIETLDGIDIDDGKQITVSVSNGSLSSVSNLSSNSTQISLTVQGGKAVFFYSAGHKAVESAILTLNLESISQVLKFKILPSEPINMQLVCFPVNPTKLDDIELTAFLFKSTNNDQFCSDNLKIDFETTKFSFTDTIQPSLIGTSFSYSKFDDQLNLVGAKKKVTTNKVPGKITAIAKYMRTDGVLISDTLSIQFTQ